ncbi:hypothetical protein D3C76_1533710 [compost metagenome]
MPVDHIGILPAVDTDTPNKFPKLVVNSTIKVTGDIRLTIKFTKNNTKNVVIPTLNKK